MLLLSNWIGIAFLPKPVRPMNFGVPLVMVFPIVEWEWVACTCEPRWFLDRRIKVGFSHNMRKFAMVDSFGLIMLAMEAQF